MAGLSPGAARVQAALAAQGFPFEVRELSESARTAADAAAALWCSVGQIAKSVVFRTVDSGRAVLVVASGANRIDETAIGALLGEGLEKADAGFVRASTGFSIGGVPPAGHERPLVTFIDADLLNHGEVWAAAGTPFAVFLLDPRHLARLTGGTVAAIALRTA